MRFSTMPAGAGTVSNFWIYDPKEGWRVYGQGRVGEDGRQFVPEQGVALQQTMGGSYTVPSDDPPPEPDQHRAADQPRLYARLGAGFAGPIVALQSENHYVRVHGPRGSELLLMPLRESIAEMGGEPGDQVHRSWWIARSGISSVERSGRSWSVHLVNGERAPVSRDAAHRLRQAGLLPRDDG